MASRSACVTHSPLNRWSSSWKRDAMQVIAAGAPSPSWCRSCAQPLSGGDDVVGGARARRASSSPLRAAASSPAWVRHATAVFSAWPVLVRVRFKFAAVAVRTAVATASNSVRSAAGSDAALGSSRRAKYLLGPGQRPMCCADQQRRHGLREDRVDGPAAGHLGAAPNCATFLRRRPPGRPAHVGTSADHRRWSRPPRQDRICVARGVSFDA